MTPFPSVHRWRSPELFFGVLSLPILVTAAVGIVLSAIAGKEVSEFETRQVISDFEVEVSSRTGRLKRELEKNIEVVLSLQSLFDASAQVSRGQFKAFVDPALERHPDIQALEWIPRVPAEERSGFEAAARQEGLTGYTITEKGSEGGLVPAALRPEYFPVDFVEPLRGNEPAVGFDLASDPTRKNALDTARRTRRPQATAAITLVQEREQQRGFLVFAPVFGGATARANGSGEGLKGFALGVFRIGAIVDSEMFDSLGSAQGYDVSLFDESGEPGDQLVYRSSSTDPSTAYADLVVSEPLASVPGRLWRVEARPSVEYLASRRPGHDSIVLAAGLLLTLMMILYLVVSTRRAAEIRRLADALRDANNRLKRLAGQDALTGLPNRRRFSATLNREWLRATRGRSPLSLLMIDVDRFKDFNDRYGHLAGDECLRQLAKALEGTEKRSIDLVSRYGGEEFAVLLADTDESGARVVAERCRAAVEGLRIPHEDSDSGALVTISVGVGSVVPSPETAPEDLLESADEALYAAKTSGRNCVFVHGRDRVSVSRFA